MTRWIILRTGGGQTLPLMRSLRAAGYDLWTPVRTIRRTLRAKTPSGTRQVESDVPILPTFVFARADQLDRLHAISRLSISPHPRFSIFTYCGKAPEVSDASVTGLREEETRAAETMAAIHAAETRDAAERIRIAALKSEAARRRATREMEHARLTELRAERKVFAPGTEVRVDEMPALMGISGVVESNDGTHAEVRFGTQSWKIEGWRLLPLDSVQLAA